MLLKTEAERNCIECDEGRAICRKWWYSREKKSVVCLNW